MIDIPADADNYIVSDSFTLPVDVSALAVTAHAHYLGKRLQALATFPDGTKHSLLNIPEWDFNWQSVYQYETPPVLPRGTQLEMRFQYDNSTGNPLNPNSPPKSVRYGPATTDEMAEILLQVLPLTSRDRDQLEQSFRRKVSERVVAHSEYVLSQHPDDVATIIKRSQALIVLNRKREALNKMEDAVRQFPREAKLHQTIAEIYLLYFKSPSNAVSSFQRALNIDPQLDGANAQLGRIYFNMRRFSDAKIHFQEGATLIAQIWSRFDASWSNVC